VREAVADAWREQTLEIGNMDIVRVMPGTAPTAATRDRPQLTRSELMSEDLPVFGTPVTLEKRWCAEREGALARKSHAEQRFLRVFAALQNQSGDVR
jgi:hypothetical protein